jgi:hypothetical protein
VTDICPSRAIKGQILDSSPHLPIVLLIGLSIERSGQYKALMLCCKNSPSRGYSILISNNIVKRNTICTLLGANPVLETPLKSYPEGVLGERIRLFD